jgi:hypothetical protein
MRKPTSAAVKRGLEKGGLVFPLNRPFDPDQDPHEDTFGERGFTLCWRHAG